MSPKNETIKKKGVNDKRATRQFFQLLYAKNNKNINFYFLCETLCMYACSMLSVYAGSAEKERNTRTS